MTNHNNGLQRAPGGANKFKERATHGRQSSPKGKGQYDISSTDWGAPKRSPSRNVLGFQSADGYLFGKLVLEKKKK